MKSPHTALALGLTFIASTSIALAAPVQAHAADAATVNTRQLANAAAAYHGNIAAAQRAMADWTHVTAIPDTAKAGSTAGEQRTQVDPPPPLTALPDPRKAGSSANAQRVMADWTHVTAMPDTAKAGKAASARTAMADWMHVAPLPDTTRTGNALGK